MTVTADNVEELHKIATVFPDAKVIISIAVDNSKLVCHFNSKFGLQQQEWVVECITSLKEEKRQKRVRVETATSQWDLSFHIGLGCGSEAVCLFCHCLICF